MSASSFQSFRPLKIAGVVSVVSLLLYGCGAPERLPSDLSMDGSKDVLKEKIIAPIKGIDEEEDLEDFVELPRRSLIQVRHAPTSLDDQYFVSTLSKLLSVEPVEADGDAEADTAAIAQNRQLDEAERTAITEQRAIQRTETLVELGLQYETQLLAALQPLDGEIKLRESTTIGGLGDAIPVFGRNLTGNGDEYLEIPADLIFVGGENGTISSKTAILKQVVQNPEITFAVRDMPLGDALDFLFGTVGLQAAIADDVKTRNAQVTMSVQAGAMAIIDSLLEQQELAIVYDPAIEVAQIYSQARVDQRLAGIRSSIENYNAVLRERKRLAKAKRDRERVMEILGYVQLLLSGDDEGFIIGIESVSREPGYTVTNDLITSMTRAALDLRSDMARFDRQTAVMMEGRSELAQLAGMPDLAGRADIKNILSEDPCIWPRQEIFTEKVAVYNAVVIEGDDRATGVIGKIDSFFAQTRPCGCRRGRRGGRQPAMPRRLAGQRLQQRPS